MPILALLSFDHLHRRLSNEHMWAVVGPLAPCRAPISGCIRSNAKYSRDKVDYYDNVDLDLMSYFELKSMCIDLGCPSTSNMYFLVTNGNLEYRLRLLEFDDDVMYMMELHSQWEVFSIVIYVDTSMVPLNMRRGSIAIQENVFKT